MANQERNRVRSELMKQWPNALKFHFSESTFVQAKCVNNVNYYESCVTFFRNTMWTFTLVTIRQVIINEFGYGK